MASHTTDGNTRPTTPPNDQQRQLTMARSSSAWRAVNSREFESPVANVFFEYGYMAGRLTRDRVAVCKLADAEIPSDLSNVKFIELGAIDLRSPRLPQPVIHSIKRWAEQLPRLVPGTQPVVQLHGYSGYWQVQNRFTLWHGYEPENNERIFSSGQPWFGSLSTEGVGKGSIIGELHILLENYNATFEIVDDVFDASTDADGVLTLKARVIRRHCLETTGDAPDSRFTEDLPNKDFDLRLEPIAGRSGLLRGIHTYEQGIRPYSIAEEVYRHMQ